MPKTPWRKIASPRALKGGDSAAKGQKKTGATGPDQTDLPMVEKKLQELRTDAAAAKRLVDRDEEKATRALAIANAELTASCTTLNKSENLQQAQRSARVACDKNNYADADSLNILATVYAGQCNFDRAVYYQKLAVIFASEDDRPAVMQALEQYRKMADLVTEKKKAKSPPSPAGQAKGSSQPAEEQSPSE